MIIFYIHEYIVHNFQMQLFLAKINYFYINNIIQYKLTDRL